MLLRIGELVYCSSLEGFYELPKGLPDNALAEVVAAYVDNTYVRYSGVTFALPNDCVQRALPDFERKVNKSAARGESELSVVQSL